MVLMDIQDVANYLINRCGYKSYIEIGVWMGHTFRKIECENKDAVDPHAKRAYGPKLYALTHKQTSDDFFKENENSFDIIFIDGLHHADQFVRDVENSLSCLNDGGVILCHDIRPRNFKEQVVPRRQSKWAGDVWKGWVKLRATREDLSMYGLDCAITGLGIIKRGKQDLLPLSRELVNPTYEDYERNREEWLNIVEWEDIKAIL